MRVLAATEPGEVGVPSEDWCAAAAGLVVVLDGATARTATGCIHGVAWYARHLGACIVDMAGDRDIPLTGVLRAAITETAQAHLHTCDLTHPGTPSAGVGILRDTADHWEYLVLGDVSVAVAAAAAGENVISDERVGATAPDERAEANRYLIGSPEKRAALLRMKRGELAARNRVGGYWIAAADSAAADHAITGTVPKPGIKAMSVLTDGAVRAVEFGLLDWTQVFAVLHDRGPGELLRIVREAEESDPLGVRWPRNKKSDDATAVYLPSP
ncbi:hypothetical protein [Catellatospora chokoriensis]|uniref:Protein phosphatase 2C-like protein n=1 Tax=Catellatospora chokoriensis TaxID=310353 RepID=A0A8J3NTI0_9ACTN|nr:hypothetical protein [Catellatospora chokoriensis]GIF92037.1 hypothetical protein Cch02nite_54810 [Catellatospora chokoriensis]